MKKEIYTDPVAEIDIFSAEEILCGESVTDPDNVGGSGNGEEVGFGKKSFL